MYLQEGENKNDEYAATARRRRRSAKEVRKDHGERSEKPFFFLFFLWQKAPNSARRTDGTERGAPFRLAGLASGGH